jgi:hypothetical protein
MKTIKIFLTMIAFAMVLAAAAVDKPTMNVISLNNEKALIAVANEKPAFFELSIIAKNGDLVYFKESANEITNLRQVIDYSNMEKGFYTLKLKVNDTYVTRDFEINSKGMFAGESKLSYAPYFKFSDEVLKFSFLNFNKENVNLKIYNDGELVFQDKLGKQFVLSTAYDLSNLEKGKYQVEISSMNNDFTYDIEK